MDTPPAQLTCCATPKWVPERDLDSAGGFDFLLGRCGQCGTPWMNVFCTASSITGYEPVAPADVEAIRAITDWRELKTFMRAWGDKHL